MKNKMHQSVMDDPSSFRRQVRMSSVQTAGLAKHEIEMALAYELEPVSGIPAAEAEVQYIVIADEDPSVCVYDVAVRRGGAGKVSTGKRTVKILSAVGVAILCAIIVDAAFTLRELSSLKKELVARRHLDEKVKSIVRAEKAARDEAQRIRISRKNAADAQEKAAKLRLAWHGILSQIASSCGGNAVVTEVSSKAPFSARMKATAVSPQAAADVMANLSAGANDKKWRVVPGSTVAGADDETAVFECEVAYD